MGKIRFPNGSELSVSDKPLGFGEPALGSLRGVESEKSEIELAIENAFNTRNEMKEKFVAAAMAGGSSILENYELVEEWSGRKIRWYFQRRG
jgi:hypothetical protein